MDAPKLPWPRLLELLLGVLGAWLYVSMDPYGLLPAPLAAALGSVPVALLLHALSGQSWKTCLGAGVGAGIGLALGTHLG